MRFGELLHDVRVAAFCDKVPQGKDWVTHSLWFADTVASDICPRAPHHRRSKIAYATICLFCYIRSLDDVMDEVHRQGALAHLHVIHELSHPRTEFRRLLTSVVDDSYFDQMWNDSFIASIDGQIRRLTAKKVDIDDGWQMSRCLLLVPLACTVAANGGDIQIVEREYRQWREMFRYSYVAKQILDDIADILEDTEHRMPSPFAQRLRGVDGTLQLMAFRETVVRHTEIAIDQLRAAHGLAADIGAQNWGRVCASWLSGATQLREEAATEIGLR